MLGLGDGWVFAAYILCVLSAILCLVYGIINWNKGAEEGDSKAGECMQEEMDIEKNI